ncbi:DUF72 domain-containing protein [Dissulfurimicrobium hydrothermale]|uniref:DUF72 domain-containing protein n=1 Tax=Dissulfurimicrobium hydrothermale TaxID=1750598 RepID=UPI001EDB8A80|nr:DUF72 domain-containing protein [Dissulfurimicrobium hydrothermale]UKL13236.1 DUF72 domain-containing protein [Dissulfurimicrobium hydrothermale]
MAFLRVGCSGFNYRDWRCRFYPKDTPQKEWLDYYSSIFNTVELNVTFYRLPLLTTFEHWHSSTPDDFGFSVKGSRFITHIKRLNDVEAPLELFFSRVLLLKEKLLVVLWQFPPRFKLDIERFSSFLDLLKDYPARNTFEFRHESWICEEILDLCRRYNVSLTMADWPLFLDRLPVTSDFVYMRRHGENGTYATSYSKSKLETDAARIRSYLNQQIKVFIYFNNDYNAYAPQNAIDLMEILKNVS